MIKKPDDLQLNYYELLVTDDCNLRCKYCFDDYKNDRGHCFSNISMSLDMISPIKDFILETRNNRVPTIISFFGGEPLVNWEFVKEFVIDIRKDKRFSFPYEFHINTNATLLDMDKINFLIENRFRISVSIDGTERVHNINRKTINDKGSWLNTVKYIPYLAVKSRSIGLMLNFLMVIDNNNYQFMAESYKFLAIDLGIPTGILFNYNCDYTKEMLISMTKQLEYLFVDRLYPLDKTLFRIKSKTRQNNWCFRPQTNVTINPKGKLTYCHRTTPKNFEITKEFPDTYGDIFEGYTNLDHYNRLSERTDFSSFGKKEPCNSCDIKTDCLGGCIAAHNFETNDFETISEKICKINKMLDNILKLRGKVHGI